MCPYCATPSSAPVARCATCGCILRLSHPDQFFANTAVDEARVRKAIAQPAPMDPFARECHLALAYLNLKETARAIFHLRAALEQQRENRLLQAFLEILQERQPETRVAATTRILVVDDSATHVMFVSQTLRRQGFEVITAAAGQEALGKLEGVDLIFLDINMPGMDGYEVCKRIKEDPGTAKVPVVMFSGKDGFFDKVRGRMVGATDYITKPCAADVLVEMVRKYCPPS